MIGPRPHTTAWYKLQTVKLRAKRLEILIIEHQICSLYCDPPPFHIIFRTIPVMINIAKDFKQMEKHYKNDRILLH